MRGTLYGLMMVGLAVACGGRTMADGALEGAGGTSSTSNDGGRSGATAVTLDERCKTACSEAVFNSPTSCRLCHGTAVKLGALDMESPGRAARLKDVPAKHVEITTPNRQCPVGDKLIDSKNVNESWMLKKLTGAQGNCGEQMPATGPLTPEQRECMTTWIRCIAAP